MKNNQNNSGKLINITLILLAVFNLIFWPAKLFGLFTLAYETILDHFFLLFLLEFLAVASIFVDVIIRWDKFKKMEQKLRFILALIFCGSFVVQMILSVMELYIKGSVG